ncbi:DUF4258 domain-containing protein [Thioalkalivibrio sp. ALgr1]|uniref:DUF4258 domain-containing protein n=1 Tax=Thioalkalivibrio sp. ALgr1 TaxID=748655 RepID=UPI0018DD29B3|nr:DUF4258 domain-containing protein [Thioalkalivibrio sp. ALgr1]
MERNGMHSQRFERQVAITRHAQERMKQRGISEHELFELIERGDLRYKDEIRLWVAKHFEGRSDNLICAAVILKETLINVHARARVAFACEQGAVTAVQSLCTKEPQRCSRAKAAEPPH